MSGNKIYVYFVSYMFNYPGNADGWIPRSDCVNRESRIMQFSDITEIEELFRNALCPSVSVKVINWKLLRVVNG